MKIKNINRAISAIVLCTIVIVVVLFYLSKASIYRGGGFKRDFASGPPLSLTSILDLRYDSYYIAGYTRKAIYLANRVSLFSLLRVELGNLDTTCIWIGRHFPEDIKFKDLSIKVDSPYYYIADGYIPFVYKGNLSSGDGEILDFRKSYFLDFFPVTDSTMVVKSLLRDGSVHLGLVDQSNGGIYYAKDLLEKQIDGIFCTDGELFKTDNGDLVYVYFYRGQYILIDPTLSLRERFETIDTTRRAKIKPVSYDGDVFSYKNMPPFVNKNGTVYSNHLYVQSALEGDSETYGLRDGYVVFDLYRINDGKYINSFSIKGRGQDVRGFCVGENEILVLMKRELIRYQRSQAITDAVY